MKRKINKENNFFESLAEITSSKAKSQVHTKRNLLKKANFLLPFIFLEENEKGSFDWLDDYDLVEEKLLLTLQQQFHFSKNTLQLLKLSNHKKRKYIVLVSKLRRSQIGRRYQNRTGKTEFSFFTKETLIGYSELFTTLRERTRAKSLEFQETLQVMLSYLLPAQKSNFSKLWKIVQEFLRLQENGEKSKRLLTYEKELKKIFTYLNQLQAVRDFFIKYFQENFKIEINDIDLRRSGLTEKRRKIKTSTLTLMKNSSLNKYFREIEFDDDLTQKQLQQLEKAIEEIFPELPKTDSIPALKIRKLGRFHAQGVYFPEKNIIAVDFRKRKSSVNTNSFTSFIHEYGHYLDYQWNTGLVLSNQEDFQRIRQKLLRNLNGLVTKSYVNKKLNYYLNSTEVFARLFEIYVFNRDVHSKVLDNSSSFKLNEYQMFGPVIKEGMAYFDDLFKK